MTETVRVIRRRPAPSAYLLEVEALAGGRTRANGALWDGVLNASPEDTNDGPSPVEALLAGVAACFVRNLRWVGDGAHVEFGRIGLKLTAERDDHPPAIREVRVNVDLETLAPAAKVVGIVERALRSGTITRTVARGARLEFNLQINGERYPVDLVAVGLATPAGDTGSADRG